MRFTIRHVAGTRGFALMLALAMAPAPARASDDWAAVKPVLERSCLSCHGPAKAKGGFRVDRADVLQEAIVVGQGADSPLIKRLRGQGGETRMPANAAPLPEADIARLQRWIDRGAKGLPRPAHDDHWAYQPPRRPALPEVRDGRWVRNEIDRFVLARLEREGLAPAPPADRATLIRRVTYDLIGLPPTLAEIAAFVGDERHDAYERVVDRLLASPHYGERWATPWLDAARYADSNGYEKDAVRAIWRYRDWVVDALNADMPFDQFTIEQLAGDLLPGATDAQRIATGFHRNTMVNEEAGVDPEEARFDRLVDRVATTGTVWLGSTLACAQCHDHKHDPFTQRDFYGLMAFFEDGAEATLVLPTAAQAARLQTLGAERAHLESVLSTWTPALGEAQRRWEQDLRAATAGFRPSIIDVPPAGTQVEADGAVLVTADAPDLAVTAQVPLVRVTGLRLEALPDARLPGGGPGRGAAGAFFLNGITLEVGAGGSFAPVPLRDIVSDDRPREEPERYAAGTLLPGAPLAPNLDPGVVRGWGVTPIYDGPHPLPRQLILVPAKPLVLTTGARLRVRLHYDHEAQREVVGRFRLSATDATDPTAAVAIEPRLAAVVRTPEAERTRDDRDRLAAAFREVTPLLAGARMRRQALLAEEAALGVTSTLVMAPHPRPRPLTEPLRLGGAFLRPGDPVAAAIPARFAGGPAPHDRLALARWLVSPANPLVARAAVNRIWEQHFGRGLVETTEDLGTAGAAPSHPELLDWLATELSRSGWRQKTLHRLIVTSATYRQASGPPMATPAGHTDRRRSVCAPRDEAARAAFIGLRARDPENRLLARGPQRRLSAEMIRDGALAVSGLLDDRLGGPPVFPAQPAGLFAPPNSTEPAWRTSEGGDRHRRALYTFWRRTAPHPSGALFDAPSRETCTVRRTHTLTPLQALATLNDPAQWEAARALASRMRAEAPRPTAQSRVIYGFQVCTGRPPRPAELRPLLALARRSTRDPLTLVANVLLNLDETNSVD